ncbi:MAG: hypothetical protein WAQ57_03745 [Candidatus Saccharimonadales bacterium]
MNDDVINDLKQFITATVSQSEERITNELDNRITRVESQISRLEQKVDDGFATIGDVISGTNDQLADHEIRLSKLETA